MTTLIRGAKGGGGSPHTPVESPDTLHSTSKAKILLCLGHGVFAGVPTDKTIFINRTPIANEDGSTNFTGVRWQFRPGTPTQEPITEFPAVESETAINALCKYNVPIARAITNRQLTAVRVRLGFPRMSTTKENGDTVGARVTYKIELATDGGAWQTVVDGIADGKCTTLYQRQHRIPLPVSTVNGWQIRVTRTTPDSTTDRVINAFNFEVLTEVIDAKLRYPGLALLYLEFDAEQFPNGIPSVSVKIKGQEVAVPSNYDPVARTYTGVWNGTFKRAWTDNPAWHIYEALTSRAWGAGRRIPQQLLEKTRWELYRVSQFADQQVPDGSNIPGKTEHRFSSNVYIQAQNLAFNVLRDLVAQVNGYAFYAGDHVSIGADMPTDPVDTVTNASVVNGRFEYSYGDVRNRYTSAVVQYDDPTNHYATTPQPVQVNEMVQRYGVNVAEITAIGCTRGTEAQRRGLYAIHTNRADLMTTFSVGASGLRYRAGSIIKIADAFTSGYHDLGGRVLDAYNDTGGVLFLLDRVPRGDITNNTVIYINGANGVMQPFYFSAIGANGRCRLRKHPNGPTPSPDAIATNATWVIDLTTLQTQQAKVMAVVDNGDGSFGVSCVEYNPGKQAAIDTGARLDDLPVTDIPPGWMGIPTNVQITADDYVAQGQRVQTMRITWNPVDHATKYRVQWRKDNGDWINAGDSTVIGVEVSGIYTGEYTARVSAINAWNVQSPWGLSATVNLTGRTGAPVPLASLTTTPLIGGVHVAWGFGADTSADTAYTELQFRTRGTSEENPLFNVPYPANAFDHMGLAPAVYFEYRGRTVDKLGNVSTWSGWVVGNSSEDIGGYIDTIQSDFLNSPEGQALVEKIDMSGNAILQNALANDADVQRRLVVDGQNSAQMIEVRTQLSNNEQTLSQYEIQLSAQRDILDAYGKTLDTVGAAVNQKMTAVVDYNGNASAQYLLRAGVNYKGGYYSAGMVLGVSLVGGVVKSRIGFNADQFIITAGSGGNISTPFVVDGGNTYIASAYIQNGVISSAKIADEISSTSYHWDPNPELVVGWAINKNGYAIFSNVTVKGDVRAVSGYFSGELRAGSGYMNNITIGASCVIQGTLSASQVRGDFVDMRTNGVWGEKYNFGGGIVNWELFWVEQFPDFDRKIIFNGICKMWNSGAGGTGTWAKLWYGPHLLWDSGVQSGWLTADFSFMEFVLPRGSGSFPLRIEFNSALNGQNDVWKQMGQWSPEIGGSNPRPIKGGALSIIALKNSSIIGALPYNPNPQGGA